MAFNDPSDVATMIRERMLSGDRFRSAEVVHWINSGDIELQGAAYEVVMSPNNLIEGEVDRGKVETFLVSYLIERMRDVHRSDASRVFDIPPHVAAITLASLYRQWRMDPLASRGAILQLVRDELKRMYLEGDAKQRQCIVNGTLEHIFECEPCRTDFDEWLSDSSLVSALSQAAEWVRPHGS